jgi:CheY-like chemotaxis protein
MVTRIRESLEGLPGSHRFDIVLTDVQMPMLDGLRASSQIRELEKALGSSTHLPIVAVTAHAMTDETSRMRSFGVDDVVTKPLDPLRLGQVMQKLTGQQTADTAHSRPTGETASGPTDIQLVELGLRLWTKVAKRDSSVGELFGLSEDPLSPEDFQRVLDIVDVGERSGNSVRRTLLIFSGFLECFRDNIKKLSEAKQSRSVEDLQFAAHALKGLLLDIGARTSGALASTIEQQCNDGDGDSAFASVGQLSKQTLLVARLVSQICEMAAGEGATQQSTHVLERDDEGEHAEQE